MVLSVNAGYGRPFQGGTRLDFFRHVSIYCFVLCLLLVGFVAGLGDYCLVATLDLYV